MHPGGIRSDTQLFYFEKSANLKHPNVHPTENASDPRGFCEKKQTVLSFRNVFDKPCAAEFSDITL